ncbi:SAVED domain-containing protein [Pseudomonas frederiksbergensis]|nr:SAVED domain-containing protein [Pseudomonas frederiksbergensis]
MAVVMDALYDQDLKSTLEVWQQSAGRRVIMAYDPDGWRFAVILVEADSNEPIEAITGDLGALSKELLFAWISAPRASVLAHLELLESAVQPIVSMDVTAFAQGALESSPVRATKTALRKFVRTRESLLVDVKRPNLPEPVVNWVYARSGGICEFEGCDKELFKDSRDHYGYYGYLAHIVAAKPKGPRGDDKLSISLAIAPANIMLCCDVHHRLIDKVEPDSYPRERLDAMVATRISWRANQAKTLSYPIVHALAFIGDIAGRATGFSQHDARKALFEGQLMPAGERVAEYLLRDSQGGNDVDDPGYWAAFIRTFQTQIRLIYETVRGHGAFGTQAEQLAIFPLGNMPAMLLGGWLISEARKIELFSFRRSAGTWVRPQELNPLVTFTWSKPAEKIAVGAKVLITLEITAEVTDAALNEELLSMPRIRITPSVQGVDVVAPAQAMERYRAACQEAWAYVVDDLKASEVSICAIASAAAVFAFGMKLQSRLHPPIHMYQMARQKPPFLAFSLDRHRIIGPHEPPNNVLVLDAC